MSFFPTKVQLPSVVKAETGLWKDFYRKCVDITCVKFRGLFLIQSMSRKSQSSQRKCYFVHSFAETNFVDKMADCQKRLVSNEFSSIIAKTDISGAAISMTISIFWQEARQLKCPGILVPLGCRNAMV